jgi:elongation factor P
MFFEGEMLGMNLPDKIELKVTHTEPAVKGNTTSSAMKDATLETGKVIKVPLFIEQDEVILVSSKDGKYVSRA